MRKEARKQQLGKRREASGCGKVSKMRVKAPFLQFVCDAMSKYIASYKNNSSNSNKNRTWQKVKKKNKKWGKKIAEEQRSSRM